MNLVNPVIDLTTQSTESAAPATPTRPAILVAPAIPATPAEPVYSAAQLADNHKAFGTSRAIVATALRLAHKDKASVAEATTLIHTFRQQEVK